MPVGRRCSRLRIIMEQNTKYDTELHQESLDAGDILYLCTSEGTVAMVKVGKRQQCPIVSENEEIILFLDPEDLIVASGFGTGTVMMNALKCIIYMLSLIHISEPTRLG